MILTTEAAWLVAAVGLVTTAAMAALSLLKPPSWLKEDKALEVSWDKLNAYSLVVALVSFINALVVSASFHTYTIALGLAPILGFAAFQTMVTDFSLRYADRRILRLASLVSLGFGIYTLLSLGSDTLWVIYLMFALGAFAIGFLPGVGDSDGRAFGLLVLSTFPLGFLKSFQFSLIILLVFVLGYFGVEAWRKRRLGPKVFLQKMSFPMVPLVLYPALFTVLVAPLLFV